MAKPELGIKRTCLSCGSKFYDLNRDPILCPKCGAPFVLAAAMRPAAAMADDEDGELVAAGAEFVPLESVDADDAAKTGAADDIEIDETIGDDEDDTFLATEEDEDDSDVSDLIDGDLEDDEEG